MVNEQMVGVQSSFGVTKIVPISGVSGPTELIALGANLDGKKFREDFYHVVIN